MSNEDRNKYSNKESARVNAGLPASPHPWSSNLPVVDIDFSTFVVPILQPEPPVPIEKIVDRLLHPPAHAFVYGLLSVQWVLGVTGMSHFDFRKLHARYVLRRDSMLRIKGAELGIPAVYMEWLCGDDASATAAEQNLVLTRGFFAELAAEGDGEEDQ
ncbi:hypothetical protein ACN47E_001068 [Coniothyrium glycines]